MVQGVDKTTGRSYARKDRVNTRNGRLVFLREVGIDRHKHIVWFAQCDCGNTTETSTPHVTKSCGCIQREIAAARCKERRRFSDEERAARKRESGRVERKKRITNPLKAMQARLSRLHRHALSRVGSLKTSPTFAQLGYTVGDFVAHIEKQFLPGMGWHNMSDWQIDHIIPVSAASSLEDVISLNGLANLRPMWSDENNKKRAKREFLL